MIAISFATKYFGPILPGDPGLEALKPDWDRYGVGRPQAPPPVSVSGRWLSLKEFQELLDDRRPF
jgi:hypothetical protein